jgi:hypothetical protein
MTASLRRSPVEITDAQPGTNLSSPIEDRLFFTETFSSRLLLGTSRYRRVCSAVLKAKPANVDSLPAIKPQRTTRWQPLLRVLGIGRASSTQHHRLSGAQEAITTAHGRCSGQTDQLELVGTITPPSRHAQPGRLAADVRTAQSAALLH